MPQVKAGSVAKVDNTASAKTAKIEIRRNVMQALNSEAHVFDAFAGTGEFYRLVWKDAASYVGCDKRYFSDERAAYVADNRRVLRAIDLARFNLFDLDAYGMPWEQAAIISARRRIKAGERIGFIFTEGGGLTYKNNVVPRAVSYLIGLSNERAVGLNRRRAEIHNAAIAALARRMNAQVVARWQGQGRSGVAVAYIGVVFESTDTKKAAHHIEHDAAGGKVISDVAAGSNADRVASPSSNFA